MSVGNEDHVHPETSYILYFCTLDDYRKLWALSDKWHGGGDDFPHEGIGARVFPHDPSQFLSQY